MASALKPTPNVSGPALATTYEGDDSQLLNRIVPLVEAIEISPDAIAQMVDNHPSLRPEVLAEYASVASDVYFIAHGIGLSIGSFDQWDEAYLSLLDQLFESVNVRWHSEHLASSFVAGESVGTMFPVPRTDEALQLVCERVSLIQQRYRVPFLLEHVIHLLPDPPVKYSAAGFLNAITSRTGCGLILDAYNLRCDVVNQGLNVKSFLDELDMSAVMEVHVAGGVLHKGFQLDIHSCSSEEATLSLARQIVDRAPNLRVVTFELLKEAIPLLGHDALCEELKRIRNAITCLPSKAISAAF
jgi:uncharacterized protein (UPF0276 family)